MSACDGSGCGIGVRRATRRWRLSDHALQRALRDPTWRALFAVFVFAGAYFFLRGPYRAWQGTVDLDLLYSAPRAWFDGSYPYDASTLDAVFAAAGGAGVIDPSLNPPPTFVILAPLAVLPWAVAEPLWTVLQVLLLGGVVALLLSLSHLSIFGRRGLAFASFALALAPVHTAVSQGQLTIPATALSALALWSHVHGKPLYLGASVALAVAFKPQMAVRFLPLLLVRGRRSALLCAAFVVALLTAVSVLRLAVAGVDWTAEPDPISWTTASLG